MVEIKVVQRSCLTDLGEVIPKIVENNLSSNVRKRFERIFADYFQILAESPDDKSVRLLLLLEELHEYLDGIRLIQLKQVEEEFNELVAEK